MTWEISDKMKIQNVTNFDLQDIAQCAVCTVSLSYCTNCALHNVLFVQYDAPVSKILGVFFWNLDSDLL